MEEYKVEDSNIKLSGSLNVEALYLYLKNFNEYSQKYDGDKDKSKMGAPFDVQRVMFQTLFDKIFEKINGNENAIITGDEVATKKDDAVGEGGSKNGTVLSFNCFYKHEHLAKTITDSKFDVICIQELCGPWLVKKAESEGTEGTEGRILEYDELNNIINNTEGEWSGSGGYPFKPSAIKVAIDQFSWDYTKDGLKGLIESGQGEDEAKAKAVNFSKGWAKWWIENVENYTIKSKGDKIYIQAEMSGDLAGYSIIFAPPNFSNGFYFCSFGNAIIYRTELAETIVDKDIDIYGSYDPAESKVWGKIKGDGSGDIIKRHKKYGGYICEEGRNALRVKIGDIYYISMHLDDKASKFSQIDMLNKFKGENIFEQEKIIVVGDMNVLDLTINPIGNILKNDEYDKYLIGRDAKLREGFPEENDWEDLYKIALDGLKDHQKRSETLWKIFQDKGLTSIYTKASEHCRHITTVQNSGGVDYVGYKGVDFVRTGVIIPKESGNANPLTNTVSDHNLPFLVFKYKNQE